MFRAQRLESPRRKKFPRLRKIVVRLFLFAFVGAGVWGGLYFTSWLGHRSAMKAPIAPDAPSQPITAADLFTPFQVLGTIEDGTGSPGEAGPAYQEPPSQTIDGLLTYGQDQPLTKSELAGLIGFLNTDPLAMEEDAYYATFLASETAFQTFAQDEGESLQAYLVRHVAWMDRALKMANPPAEGGLVARRFIILADGVFKFPWDVRSRRIDYVAHGLLDSDGSWSFVDIYCPKSCGFYNTDLELDTALLHEWIHAIFHLPDHYAFDLHASTDIHTLLEGSTELWQSFWSGRRPDISHGDFAMGGGGFMLRHYSALQLLDRRNRGNTHDNDRNRYEMGFLAQVPQVSVLDFGPESAGAGVLIYQTQACPPESPNRKASSCKILVPDPVLDGRLDERGRIVVGNLFARYEVKVPVKEGVLFIKVTNGDETWFRWMDIRDFNLAYWHGFTNSVLMRMDLASAADDPNQFSWEIKYREVYPKEPTASE